MPDPKTFDPQKLMALLQWAIANAPALVSMIQSLIELLKSKPVMMAKFGAAAGCDPDACSDACACCHEAIPHLVAALSLACKGCECDPAP